MRCLLCSYLNEVMHISEAVSIRLILAVLSATVLLVHVAI